MGWVSPTGHTEGDWTNEANAYDGNTGTAAEGWAVSNNWTAYIELDLTGREPTSVKCNKVRFWASPAGAPVSISVDVKYVSDNNYHNVFEGAFSTGQWVEKTLANTVAVKGARIKTKGTETGVHSLHEFDFYEIEPAISPLVNGGVVR